MKRDLRNTVVVITGASSGIGKITAIEFAKHGANLVLAARRENGLEKTARECENFGVRALVVPTDVSDELAVHKLASRALNEFGRVDTWINNAGVYMMGEIKDTPVDAMRRLLDVNFFGMVHGVKAILPHMLQHGRGLIINTGSQAGKMAYRFASAYCASKFAITAFTDALRQELYGTGVDVSMVMPNSTDTPLFNHAANYAGRVIKPMEPVSDAADVADVIIRLAESHNRERYVTGFPKARTALQTVAPSVHDHLMARQTEKKHFKKVSAPPSKGNLFQPDPSHTGISGGWKNQEGSVAKNIRIFAAIAIPIVAGVIAWRRMQERQYTGFEQAA
jgi:short-subunit dehydrogenase